MKSVLLFLFCISIFRIIEAQVPSITSFTPTTGTSFTKITINGSGFTGVNPSPDGGGVGFGGVIADSGVVVSDNQIIAWVGLGASGKVQVSNGTGTDTLAGFTYTPVPPVTNSKWGYFGNAGFSNSRAYYINAACGSNNLPFVVFKDSTTGKALVMQYTIANTWTAVGSAISDGKCSNTNIVLDNSNNPIVAYIDSANGGLITVKKYNAGNWSTLGTPGFALGGGFDGDAFSMAVDNTNTVYISSLEANSLVGGDSITVFKFNGTNWVTVGTPGFANCYFGANIAVDKTANTPYVVFDDESVSNVNYGYPATVMKFNGSSWVVVGTGGFNNTASYYTDIEIDNAGNPIVSMQEDNGFERMSVYRFSGSNWDPIGYRYFSQGISFFNCLAIDKKNNPYALFEDASYNGQGTVMTFNSTGGNWTDVGARGFIPFASYNSAFRSYSGSFARNPIVTDTSNTPLVAFSDTTNGGKVSVMRYLVSTDTWLGGISSDWMTGGNWSRGTVPGVNSNVVIPAGTPFSPILSAGTNTSIMSISLSSGTIFTVQTNATLKVTN